MGNNRGEIDPQTILAVVVACAVVVIALWFVFGFLGFDFPKPP